jgi:HPt (histidine-containing phosphotransfer) domain-containing protein
MGLTNAGGNGVLYRRMMSVFRERKTGFTPRFRAARAGGDAAAQLRAAHDLKSTAGTLGMHAVQAAAAALERACWEGAPDADLDDLVREVAEPLDQVIEGLRALETTPVT